MDTIERNEGQLLKRAVSDEQKKYGFTAQQRDYSQHNQYLKELKKTVKRNDVIEFLGELKESDEDKEWHRKPIVTMNNARDAMNNPELNDIQTLMFRFWPLLQSIYRKFSHYPAIYSNRFALHNLWDEILLQFCRLHHSYDPRRGVDFVGYIKFHLQQNVYQWVTKWEEIAYSEIDYAPISAANHDDEESLTLSILERTSNKSDTYSEENDREMLRADASASIPWDALSPVQAKIVKDTIAGKCDVESIQSRLNLSYPAAYDYFESLCKRIAYLCNPDTISQSPIHIQKPIITISQEVYDNENNPLQ